MALDYGRRADFEELAKAIDNAKSTEEREHYEQIAYRITHESAPIQSLRDELLRAFRARDMYRVKAIQHHIQMVRLEETNGGSWGSNRLEKKIN